MTTTQHVDHEAGLAFLRGIRPGMFPDLDAAIAAGDLKRGKEVLSRILIAHCGRDCTP